MNTELQQLETEIINGVQQCSHCRMCVTVCPTYEGWFTQTSMGRLAAIYAHLRYGLGSEEELGRLLFSCSTCRRCQTLCRAMSAGAETTDLIVKTRSFLAKRAEARGVKKS